MRPGQAALDVREVGELVEEGELHLEPVVAGHGEDLRETVLHDGLGVGNPITDGNTVIRTAFAPRVAILAKSSSIWLGSHRVHMYCHPAADGK